MIVITGIIVVALFSILIVAIYGFTHSMVFYAFWHKLGNNKVGAWWDWRWTTRRAV